MTICQSQKDQAKQAVAVPPAHGYRRVRVAGGQTQATASSPDTMPAPELNLPENSGAVQPRMNKAEAVGGSVVPTNARPQFGEHQ